MTDSAAPVTDDDDDGQVDRERTSTMDTHARAVELAHLESELGMEATFYEKLMDGSSAGVDHARDSAKFVQVVTAALTGVYTTMLGLAFSANDRPLPFRAVLPTMFFGVALALSLVYLAFFNKPIKKQPPTGETDAERQVARAAWFAEWVAAGLAPRAWAMRSAVIAFAAGVALLPAPFVAATSGGVSNTLPSPPSIPSAIAPEIAESAAELFHVQSEFYVRAVASEPVAMRGCPTSHVVDFIWKCTWRTESGINTAFLQLALLGLALVICAPAASTALRPITRRIEQRAT